MSWVLSLRMNAYKEGERVGEESFFVMATRRNTGYVIGNYDLMLHAQAPESEILRLPTEEAAREKIDELRAAIVKILGVWPESLKLEALEETLRR